MMLEIAANSVASAVAAQDGGAGRVELCTALELGGLTPSHAQIALARERLHIPLYVLVRPRAGDFLYSDLECETMQRDIEACAALGCDGVVLGVLDANGEVDMPRCRALIGAAGTMGVTFHRAFDLTRDPLSSLGDLIQLGCERVLTSGARASAPEGAALIRQLVELAAGRIVVMPGAGVDAGNIGRLREVTGASEFHASAKRQHPSGMRWQPELLKDMQGGESRSDVEQVRGMVAALNTTAALR
ncbi:copper homeostasis protein CutC [Bacillus sp. SRB_336]|nr:copper homeostasis protein CutC [Bacillus sp. SRB_336]